MLFKIKAKNASGEITEGVREAPDRFSLARDMRHEGLTVFFAEPLQSKKSFSLGSLFKSVGLKDKIVFASNLSSMISAGLSLARSLEVLARQTTRPFFKGIIRDLLTKVNSGESFSSALADYPTVFPPVFSAMVAAGEESGKLPQALTIIKDQMEKTYELKRKVVGAMIYPAIIIVAIVAIAILMMTFMVPQLSATFNDLKVELPLSTRLVIGTSDWLTANIWLFLVGLVVLIIAVLAWLRTEVGQITVDRIVIRLPVLGNLVREYNSAVVMRTVSSLISSGVSMTESMLITGKILQNRLYRPVIESAAGEIEKGILLSAVLTGYPKLFPVLATELTEVGEETGDLPKLLAEGAAFYEGEIDQATKNLSTIIEPVLMVVIGIAVGFFVIAMIGPMYSLSSAIK
ncbi:MAG: type II secretion system F family protein [Candidatus Vogelbacteria bacterium]|nr:type II secretion system F family protein [Candidatus Vogelbacteria bacterium]